MSKCLWVEANGRGDEASLVGHEFELDGISSSCCILYCMDRTEMRHSSGQLYSHFSARR